MGETASVPPPSHRPQMPGSRAAVSDVLKAALGGSGRTYAHYDEGERHAVAVMEAVGTPNPGSTTYATASLHAFPNLLDGEDIRVELLMTASESPDAANMVATAAFCVMKDGWLAAPGVVFPDIVREYIPSTTVPHVMWSEPFSFKGLSPMLVPGLDHEVHPLQAVPIAASEWQFLLENGFFAFTERLAAADAPLHDLHRASVCP